MIPMTFADVGKEHIIRKVGGNSEVRAHLENLGFVPGAASYRYYNQWRKFNCKCKTIQGCNQ